MRPRWSGETPEPAFSTQEQEVIDLEARVSNYQPRRQGFTGAFSQDIDEEEEEDIASRELAAFIDLTIDDDPIFIRQARRRCRQPQVFVPEKQHDKIRHGEFWVKVNGFYEIESDLGPDSAIEIQFLLVTSITENLATQDFKISGMPYCRSRKMMAKLPRKLNEVFQLHELDEDDDRPAQVQALIEVPIAALVRHRRLHQTNAPYPRHRYVPRGFSHHEQVEKEGPLVCRWKFYIHYRDSKKRAQQKAHHWTLERIRADEVKRNEFRVEESDLRQNWRGETNPGGSHIPNVRDNPGNQKFTVFDSFCGAGGFSRGAERAGLHVQYAVDHWDNACETYKLNFADTELSQMSVDEFILSKKDVVMRTDILHLSPPCQTWSPAHTIPGANDEANIAALFACRSLVEKLRPRIFTLEQTFGILQVYHDPFFCSLVGGFTELGYSVTWKIVHLQSWGLPQVRKRLIMIGACPGEKLPPFPTATHSETGAGGLSKFVTIRQALRKIDRNSTWHDPEEEVKDSLPAGSVVSDPDTILRRCVTCSGGQNMHWSNTRAYTIREFASLQGFPVWHKFAPASKAKLKKQIGNAFPACVVRLLYEHLKNWLLEVDGLASPRASRASVGGRELIFVSESPIRDDTPPAMLPAVLPLLMPLEYSGDSMGSAIMLDDDDDQCEIKFDYGSDVEMDEAPDFPGSPRSATLSLGGTPEPVYVGGTLEPVQVGQVEDMPIVID